MRPALPQLRCSRHPEREAAAKCVSCETFFCRECVTEHEGKMLCAECLRMGSAPKSTSRNTWFQHPLRALLVIFSLVLLWLAFYGAGKLLLTVPDRFHEGILSAEERNTP